MTFSIPSPSLLLHYPQQTWNTTLHLANTLYKKLPVKVQKLSCGVAYTALSVASLSALRLIYAAEACQSFNGLNLPFNCQRSVPVSISVNLGLPTFALLSAHKALAAFNSAMQP